MLTVLASLSATWPGAFALTLLIEVPIWVLVLGPLCGGAGRRALAGGTASAVTHPLLWAVAPLVATAPLACGGLADGDAVALCFGRWILGLEVLIVVGEAGLVGAVLPVRMGRALAASLAANAASYGFGLLLRVAAG